LKDLLNIKVTTATKTAEKNSLTPAIITVITARDIQTFGYESVAEALSHVAGFVETNNLALHNFGVRGINAGVRAGSRTIKFMIDGNPVAFRSTSQHFIDKELIPMDLIERIEIIRGPASALYGANAFLGVVNVITRNAEKYEQIGNQVSLTVGRIESAGNDYHLTASAGHQFGTVSTVVGLGVGRTDRQGLLLPRGSPDFDLFADNTTAVSDDARPLSLYGKVNWALGEHNQFKLSGHYQKLDVENAFSDINALRENGVTRVALTNWFLRLDDQVALMNNLDARLFVAYSEGKPDSEDRIEVGNDNSFLERNIGYTGLDAGAELIWNLETNTFLFGIDASHDEHDLETFIQVDRATGDRTDVTPRKSTDINNKAFYAQWQHNFGESWRTVVGLRVDDNTVIDKQQSFRAGIVGELPYKMIVKLLAGSSFQAPSPELLFREPVQAGDIIGNPELDAQTAETVELALSAPIGQPFYVSGTLFHTKIEDLVVFEDNSTNLVARNSTESLTTGFEAEIRFKQSNLSAYLNYIYQDTSREPDPLTLSVLVQRDKGELFPENSANFGASYF